MQSLLILGRQPELGLAELESLYGADKVLPISSQAAIVDVDPCLLTFNRLGGSLKFSKLLTTLDTVDWFEIEKFLTNAAPEQSKNMPEGKMTLGISLYGFNMPVSSISKSALNIKRAIQKTGRSVRIVPNKEPALNSAQVIYNKLTKDRSWELLIIKSEAKTYIAQTVMVQDIDSYAKRDQARPNRDSKVGMLPPKLAQIILNLASGKLNESELKSICEDTDKKVNITSLNQTVLDPFSGSGVLLQEASLMGYEVIGSDIDPRMVEYTKKNLTWLAAQYKLKIDTDKITTGDARKLDWANFNFIATETNLGKPLSNTPPKSEVDSIAKELDSLIEQFLINVARQTKPGLRLTIAIPAWQISKNEFRHLSIIDRVTDMGYNPIDFQHIGNKPLIYYRPDQIVARQLLTLIRK